jgi:hypothetical protein
MRSNIKAAPGSQGTLFQGGQKSGNKWARGYAPERLAEVRDALAHTPVVGGDRPRQVGVNEAGEPRYDSPQLRSFVTQELARSSVPAQQMQGIARIGAATGEGRQGAYWPKTRTMDLKVGPDVSIHKAGATLIHELGHHVDLSEGHTATTLDPLLQQDHRTYAPQAKGRAEGFADTFMENHFVPHPNSPYQDAKHVPGGTYDQRFNTRELASHYPGYLTTRPGPRRTLDHLGPQFGQHQQQELF